MRCLKKCAWAFSVSAIDQQCGSGAPVLFYRCTTNRLVIILAIGHKPVAAAMDDDLGLRDVIRSRLNAGHRVRRSWQRRVARRVLGRVLLVCADEAALEPPVCVLRKDFVIDAYQLLEARAHGADTALLIVNILSADELAALMAASRALGMEPLVEVNTEAEMTVALAAGAKTVMCPSSLRTMATYGATSDAYRHELCFVPCLSSL